MPPSPPRFSLDSLMLIIPLIAACTAVIRLSLPLDVLLSVMSALALARTVAEVTRGQVGGRNLYAFDKVVTFCVSSAVVLLAITPGLMAFMLVTIACMKFRPPLPLGLTIALLAAFAASYASLRVVNWAIREGDW